MEPQDTEEEINIGGIAFVIILLFSLGMVAPYMGMMEQCSEKFILARPICVSVETWKVLTNIKFNTIKICEKVEISPEVRNKAVSIVEKNSEVNVGQMIEIYTWINDNIGYVQDPVSEEYFATGAETLETKAGDCDDQAILATGMINSIGGISKLVIAPTCEHAFSSIYVSDDPNHFQAIESNIREIYAKDYGVEIGPISYYLDEEGYWIIADPAGGHYLGDILPECEGEEFEPIC